MASVSIQCILATGDQLGVRVKAETSYPDALAEATAEALKAFHQALTEIRTTQVTE